MTTQELIAYYVDLLIAQYHDKPNAQAEIAVWVAAAISDQIIQSVIDAFNLPLNYFDENSDMYLIEEGGDEYLQSTPPPDIAVGAQLDIIGKYVGVGRTINGLELGKVYFAMPAYSDDSSLFAGFATYGDAGVSTTYFKRYFADTKYQLVDTDYQNLLLLKIRLNKTDCSLSDCDNILTKFFGSDCVATDNENMTITYAFNPAKVTDFSKAVAFLELLPHPAGVAINITGVSL